MSAINMESPTSTGSATSAALLPSSTAAHMDTSALSATRTQTTLPIMTAKESIALLASSTLLPNTVPSMPSLWAADSAEARNLRKNNKRRSLPSKTSYRYQLLQFLNGKRKVQPNKSSKRGWQNLTSWPNEKLILRSCRSLWSKSH